MWQGGGGFQTPLAQDRFTKVISMNQWIRTSRLSIKNSLSGYLGEEVVLERGGPEVLVMGLGLSI